MNSSKNLAKENRWRPFIIRRGYNLVYHSWRKLKIRGLWKQSKPFSNKRGSANYPVLITSLPKSGTYFLASLVDYLGICENINIHIGTHGYEYTPYPGADIKTVLCYAKYALRKLKKGQYVPAHLSYSKDIEKEIERLGIVAFFMYRDPRDVLTSLMRYYTYSEKYSLNESQRKYQQFMRNNFIDDAERLRYIIYTKRVNYFSSFIGWLDSDIITPIKFEDLLLEIMLCKENKTLGENIKRILLKLGIKPASIDPVDLFENVYGKSITYSSLPKKIGQYKEWFREEHYKMLDTQEFRLILDKMGYK